MMRRSIKNSTKGKNDIHVHFAKNMALPPDTNIHSFSAVHDCHGSRSGRRIAYPKFL
jgi:hypothetical protein